MEFEKPNHAAYAVISFCKDSGMTLYQTAEVAAIILCALSESGDDAHDWVDIAEETVGPKRDRAIEEENASLFRSLDASVKEARALNADVQKHLTEIRDLASATSLPRSEASEASEAPQRKGGVCVVSHPPPGGNDTATGRK